MPDGTPADAKKRQAGAMDSAAGKLEKIGCLPSLAADQREQLIRQLGDDVDVWGASGRFAAKGSATRHMAR